MRSAAPRTGSAFPAALARLGAVVARAEIDVASLRRPLAPCRLSHCRGTCCHDGVVLSEEEAGVVAALARERGELLADLGADTSAAMLASTLQGTPKTAVRPRRMRLLVEGYPEHFPETACAFLGEDGACALQLLATGEGRHPWFYKPVACWLHPLRLPVVAGSDPVRHRLTLPDADSDPDRAPGYPGYVTYTHCGATEPCGRPAAEVLAPELKFLGELADRDILGEVAING